MTEQEYFACFNSIKSMIEGYLTHITEMNECSTTVNDVHIVLNKADEIYNFSLTRGGITINNSFKVEHMDDTVTEEHFMAGYLMRFVN
jgi:hypothetical protein